MYMWVLERVRKEGNPPNPVFGDFFFFFPQIHGVHESEKMWKQFFLPQV